MAAVALLVVCSPAAQAGLLVAVTGSGSTNFLRDVDRNTGAMSNPQLVNTNGGSMSGFIDVEFDESGTLYGVKGFAGGEVADRNAFFRIDVVTGTVTRIGATGLTEIAEGDLAFDLTTNTLFGTSNGISGHRDLFTIDRNTGAATVLGSIGGLNFGGDFSGMTIDPRTGNLYVINTGAQPTPTLLQIDKTNASILSTISLSIPTFIIGGFDYDPVLDKFLVARGGATGVQTLFSIDLTTGALTTIGPMGFTNTTGLATFGPPPSASAVPEPASATLLAINLAVAALSRRRWKNARKSPE